MSRPFKLLSSPTWTSPVSMMLAPPAAGTQHPESQLPCRCSLLGPIGERGITGQPGGCYKCCRLMHGGQRVKYIQAALPCSLHVNNAWAASAEPITGLRSGGIRRLLMVLIIWGRLPSGMWAAWAGSQHSGHLHPTGGRFGGGGKRRACIDQSPIRRINGMS